MNFPRRPSRHQASLGLGILVLGPTPSPEGQIDQLHELGTTRELELCKIADAVQDAAAGRDGGASPRAGCASGGADRALSHAAGTAPRLCCCVNVQLCCVLYTHPAPGARAS